MADHSQFVVDHHQVHLLSAIHAATLETGSNVSYYHLSRSLLSKSCCTATASSCCCSVDDDVNHLLLGILSYKHGVVAERLIPYSDWCLMMEVHIR